MYPERFSSEERKTLISDSTKLKQTFRHNEFQQESLVIYRRIVEVFQDFLLEFEIQNLAKPMKCLFYAMLKVEGDILLDLNEHDLAIKCFKTLKDYCDVWGDMEKLKMKTYE